MPSSRSFTLPAAAAIVFTSCCALQPPARAADAAAPDASTDPFDTPLVCPEELFLGEGRPPPPRRTPVAPTDPIEIDAGRSDGEIGGEMRLSDGVRLTQGDRTLSADEVRIDSRGRSARVEGEVTYRDPELIVRGRAGEYEQGIAQIDEAEFELPFQPARGSARRLRLDAVGGLSLTGVRYTTCPRDARGWRIAADSVSIDPRKQAGVARGARVEFQGVPILYLPWISFPAGPARKSGFLFPGLGNSSRSGLQISVPYYFNLAPNYDLIATPTLYARRGMDLGGEFRFLGEGMRASLDGNYLPDDDLFGEDRGRARLLARSQLPGNWLLRINAENVSDVAYFEDFSQGADTTSIAFLPRALHLSYRDDHWRAGALVRNFQTIDAALPAADRPYTELPRLYASGWWGLPRGLPLHMGFDVESTGFHRSTGVTGWRLDAQPQMGLRFEGAGWFLAPTAAWRSTAWSLEDTAPGQPRSPTRNLPVLSVDTGLVFERPAGPAGGRRITLEPRVMYLYVPFREQDSLPVFDTALPDLNWVQLFRDNRYVGGDRVGDANQITAGVTTRLFGSEDGARHVSATIGQVFYFDPLRVRMPDEPLRPRRESDLIAQLELRTFRDWSVDLGVQWDHRERRAERSEVRLQYRPASQHVANVAYRFQRDRLEQLDVSAAWPVAPDWRLYGRMLYSLRDEKAIEQFAGVEYGSCCWGLRAVARRYVSNRTGERDTGFFLQLELKGLSSVGTAADAFLERAIRGYSASP